MSSMSTKRRVAVGVTILCAFAVAWSVWRMEAGLSAHRTIVSAAEPYWSCHKLPTNAAMAKVYANSVVRREGYGWHGVRWKVGSLAYQLYYRMRLSDAELTDAFLRTPSRHEQNCQPIGARIA